VGTICGIQGSDGMEYLKGEKKSTGRPNTFTAKLTLHQFVGEALIPPVLT